MTREEEIKARLDEEFVHWIVDDRSVDYKVAGDSAEPDIRYLLARNEELQRENEKMQAVVDVAGLIPVGMPMAIRNTDFSTAIGNIRRALKMLDTKEHHDA